MRVLLSAGRISTVTVTLLTVAAASVAAAGDLPDLRKTPGKTRVESVGVICHTRWGIDARHATEAMKREAFARYGFTGNDDDPKCVPDARGRHCEIDHLISRELGGADDVDNLWPQPYGTSPWNAQRKDRLENRLHHELCDTHTITLRTARQALLHDWRKAYRHYFGEP